MRVARTSARVLLLDQHGAVLLLCGSDPAVTDVAAPRWWFTVGGEAHPGEDLTQTAVREVAEETGLLIVPQDVTGPLWRRESVIRFNGSVLDSDEFYFVHRTRRFDPSPVGRTDLERRYIHGHRWCDAAAIGDLEGAGQRVYPRQLADLLAEAGEWVGRPPGGSPRPIT